VVDSLVQKGVISADAGTDIMRQGSTRAQIELCIQEVMKGGGPAYSSLCETLQEHGYNNIVDALKGDASVTSVVPGNVLCSKIDARYCTVVAIKQVNAFIASMKNKCIRFKMFIPNDHIKL